MLMVAVFATKPVNWQRAGFHTRKIGAPVVRRKVETGMRLRAKTNPAMKVWLKGYLKEKRAFEGKKVK